MSDPQPEPSGIPPSSGEATSDLGAGGAQPLEAAARRIPGTVAGPQESAVQIPGYTLLSVLGRGGMGVVFLARQERLQRHVAVKMLTVEAAHDAAYLARLEREAQTLATLNHPHIVGCHDVLATDQGTFLVMPFVPGHLSARDLLKRFGRIPEATVARIARDTASGLAYAHRKGICHRDVKPDNLLVYREDPTPPHTPEEVFLSPHARVMICDFGIARRVQPGSPGDTTRILGSPAYMAPEQASNAAGNDFRADLYALGCSLFHLLTGQHPFPGATGVETLQMKLDHDLPDPEVHGVTVSAACRRVLARLGRRDPGQRYGSYAELLADLEAWAADLGRALLAGPGPRPGQGFWRGLTVGVGAAALLAGVAAGILWHRRIAPRPVSCTASLGYWAGDRAAWRVAPPDAETPSPVLVGLTPGRPLELRHPIHGETRVRLRVRLPMGGRGACALRQGDRERWHLRWERDGARMVLVATADGRDIPLVPVDERRPLDWLALDLRLRERQVDLYADGRQRGIAPLREPLGEAGLVIEMQGGCLAQFGDLWITALP